MPKNKTSWIIVANDGAGSGLRNPSNVDFVSDNRKSRDIVSDGPGRSEGVSSDRHAMEPRVDDLTIAEIQGRVDAYWAEVENAK